MLANRKTRATPAKISRQDRPGARAGESPRPRHHAKTQAAPELAAVDKVLLALNRGDSVGQVLRDEISTLLLNYWIGLQHQEEKSRRGRPPSIDIKGRARAARVLVEDYDVKVAAAVDAVIDRCVWTDKAKQKLGQTIEREYRKQRKTERRSGWDLFSSVLDTAKSRLSLDKRKK